MDLVRSWSELSALSINGAEIIYRRTQSKTMFGKSPCMGSKAPANREYKKRSLFVVDKNKRTFKTAPAGHDNGDVPCTALDMNPKEFETEKHYFVQRLELDEDRRMSVEANSRGQNHNELWKQERQIRFTASNFGMFKKRDERPRLKARFHDASNSFILPLAPRRKVLQRGRRMRQN